MTGNGRRDSIDNHLDASSAWLLIWSVPGPPLATSTRPCMLPKSSTSGTGLKSLFLGKRSRNLLQHVTNVAHAMDGGGTSGFPGPAGRSNRHWLRAHSGALERGWPQRNGLLPHPSCPALALALDGRHTNARPCDPPTADQIGLLSIGGHRVLLRGRLGVLALVAPVHRGGQFHVAAQLCSASCDLGSAACPG